MKQSSVHMIGIGGTGLSAIARVLLEKGYAVSGSDRQLTPLAAALQDSGVKIFIGHHAGNVGDVDLVIRSSAIQDDNVEVQAAKNNGIPVFKRVDFLDQLMQENRVIAVAGTHGKTTTTAMIAWMITKIGLDPSFIIGGVAKNLQTNAHAGRGHEFVIEADEYDFMFLGLNPDIAVVTNMEYDHPDCFPTRQDFYRAFVSFADRIKPEGMLLYCCDDPGATALGEEFAYKCHAISYGLDLMTANRRPEYFATDMVVNDIGCFSFGVNHKIDRLIHLELRVPGEHNVQNAVAAIAVAEFLALPIQDVARALGAFEGTGRRFEVRSEVGGVILIDDYAHHPSEIRATLAAARSKYPHKIVWAVWQPHTYSRTTALWQEFTQAFRDADHVIVTDVYGARENKPESFSIQAMVKNINHPSVSFAADLQAATLLLMGRLGSNDVVLVLSAGDADSINTELMEIIENRASKRNA